MRRARNSAVTYLSVDTYGLCGETASTVLGSSSLGCARYIFATFGPGLSSHFLAPLLKFILLHLRLRPQHYFANPAVIRGLRFFAGHIPHFDFFFNKRGKLVWGRIGPFRFFWCGTSVDPRPAHRVTSNLIGAMR